jgi:TRAP-type uncharacterized transport system substrate-binding protein
MKKYLWGSTKSILITIFAFLLLLGLLLRFIFPAPPKHLRIAASMEGSYFSEVAEKYKEELAKEGVTLEIINTHGAFENLQMVKEGKVDLALTHGGLTQPRSSPNLVSLGSISYEPVWVFRRKGTPVITDITQVKGMRVNIGSEGSGVKILALKLLNLSGVNHVNTTFSNLTTDESIDQLISGRIDVGFFMDPPENPKIQALFKSEDILEVDLKDSEAFRRNLRFLHVTNLAPSTIDLELEQPTAELHTVSVTNTLVVNRNLHTAIQYLLLSILDRVHHHPTLISNEDEFPSDKDVDLPLSQEADFFYKKGMPFLTQYLPFELASILERLLKALLPIVFIIFPLLNSIPTIIEWRTKRKFSNLYLSLIEIEKLIHSNKDKLSANEFESMLNALEEKIVLENIPLSFSSDVYVLREHIELAKRQIHKFTQLRRL